MPPLSAPLKVKLLTMNIIAYAEDHVAVRESISKLIDSLEGFRDMPGVGRWNWGSVF